MAYQQGFDQPSSSAGPYAPPPNFAGAPQGYPPQGAPQGYAQQGAPQGYAGPGGPPQGYMGGPPPVYDPQSYQQPQSFQQPQGYYDPSFGYPQPGYDPQAFALQQAEAELAALEEKKKAREEKQKAHEVEHLTHKIRSGARDHADNQACARLLCMWGVFNGLMYGLALLGDSWWSITWHAMSVDDLSITLGLFNVQIDLTCKDTVDMKICNMMKKWADHDGGHWATQELRDTMCEEYKGACPVVDRLYWAGWPVLVLFPAAAGFECFSLLLLYFYWHVKPSALTRVLADKCGVAALFCAMTGFLAWFTICPWLVGLPRLWCEMAGQQGAASGMFAGFKQTWNFPFRWCFIAGAAGLLGNFCCLMSQLNLPYHVDEPDPYGIDEGANLIAEAKAEVERTYGTA